MDAHSLECLDFSGVRELLANYASTSLGKNLALMIRPTRKKDLIRRWLAQVVELDAFSREHGLPPFAGISDIREIIRRCAPPLRVTVEDVACIGETLTAISEIRTYVMPITPETPESHQLAGRIGDFQTIAARITRVIDERSNVRDDASPKLARIRREIERAGVEVRASVERLLHDPGVRRMLQYPNYTFHADRLVLPLRAEHRGRLPGIVHRSSDSGATLYVEPAAAVAANNQIANLRSEEQEEIHHLLWELTHEIYLNEKEIARTLDALAVLDLTAAKVRFARDYALCCPVIRDDGKLFVHEARHPLLMALFRREERTEAPPRRVVPISYRLGDDMDMIVITGPNTGGKTVTLKTIGLLSLMVQSGIPVPAAPNSEFCVFGDILIDIGDEQSMQQSLSTFSAHLKRQLEMLSRAGGRTLVLIDELGAGTDPEEGAAIGRAILDELLRLHAKCVVTTHLGALKTFALVRNRAENACVEFDLESMQPTYHLRIGEAGASNAINIAERLGMPRRLVESSRKNIGRHQRALRSALEGAALAKREAEDARKEADRARGDAARAARAAEAARTAFQRKQADFHAWLEQVVHLQPGDPVRVRNFHRDGKVVRMRLDLQRAEVDMGVFTIESPLSDLMPPETPAPPAPPLKPAVVAPKPKQRPAQPRERNRPAVRPGGSELPVSTAQAARQRPSRLSDQQLADLQPGDRVYAKRFHRDATIVRVNAEKRVVIASVGLFEAEIPFDGLAPLEPEGTRRTGRASRKPAGNGKTKTEASRSSNTNP